MRSSFTKSGDISGSCGAGLGIARAERRLGGWIRTAPGECRDGLPLRSTDNVCASLRQNSVSFCSGAGTGPGTAVHDILLPDLDDVMCDNITKV